MSSTILTKIKMYVLFIIYMTFTSLQYRKYYRKHFNVYCLMFHVIIYGLWARSVDAPLITSDQHQLTRDSWQWRVFAIEIKKQYSVRSMVHAHARHAYICQRIDSVNRNPNRQSRVATIICYCDERRPRFINVTIGSIYCLMSSLHKISLLLY